MGTKRRPKTREYDSDQYDEYDDFDDYTDDLDVLADMGKLSKDFYSADWEDPSGPESRFSTRRKIERRNDLKKLYSQFDGYDEIDLGNDW